MSQDVWTVTTDLAHRMRLHLPDAKACGTVFSLAPFPAGPQYPCGVEGSILTMNERTYLRYRRSAIERWPESARKSTLLAAIASREGQLDLEDKLRAEAEAGVSGGAWQRAQELP